MKRVVVIVVVAAVLLAMAIAALAPASLVAPSLERATRGRVVADERRWLALAWARRAGRRRGAPAGCVEARPGAAPDRRSTRIQLTPVDGTPSGLRADILAAEHGSPSPMSPW